MALALGIALAAAPVVLQMFTRGPGGAAMLADFRPYMQPAVLSQFQASINQVDAAATELSGRAPFLAAARLGLSQAQYESQYSSLVQFERNWPTARDNLTKLISTIRANVGNYQAVAALPSFTLFPYFFLIPGVLIAVVGWLGLRRRRRGVSTGRLRLYLGVLGVGLIAAPLMFQMFTRAPKGEAMLNAFRPLMTTQQITTVQTYFLTMGGGEAAIRGQLLPALRAHGMSDAQVHQVLPQTEAFVSVWTTMANRMAPMLAAMNDNLAHYNGLIALPPFGLFPYFFVAPGLILILLAGLAGARTTGPTPPTATPAGATGPALTSKES